MNKKGFSPCLTAKCLIALASICSTSMVTASGKGVHWSYAGADGPSKWSSLAPEYSLCGGGINQSPINILKPAQSTLFKLEFNYGNVPLQIVNNGHTIQINYNTTTSHDSSSIKLEGETYNLPSATSYNSYISISGEEYRLLQVHFHSPSEHQVNGKPYPMEAHLVHGNSAGQLAVVGVLLKEGAQNTFLRKLWSNMPMQTDGVHEVSGMSVNAEELLPDNRASYHYRGSLTTPPCSEGVRWFVMRNPVELSSSQISKFLSVVNENARPVQPLNSRFLLTNK